MTKQRVQVQDLPDAPQLQATVRSGGQWIEAVPQAGRNKLMDLVDQLSMVNPALREYGAIADIDAEMHEDELSRLSTDEVKARLSNTEEQLDSLSRKGFIPWLASPLNQKRKRRAEGKAAQKVFYDQLISSEGRFNNPLEGDDGKTSAEIINEEVAKFAENNPALQGQYVSEGFQEALNPRITQLTAQYDAEKSRVARAETLLNNTSSIYSAAKDAALDSAQYDIDMAQGLVDWSELNSFNAAQQIKVIENVAEQLAKVDERRAYTFLKWADKNLKVGNGKLGEDQYDRMLDMIEREVEVQGRLDDAERDDKKELIASQFTLAVNAIQNSGESQFNGETFKDTSLLLKAYQEFVAQDGDPVYAAQSQLEFEKVLRGDVDTDEHTRREILGNSYAYSRLHSTVTKALDTALTDYADVEGNFRNLQLRSSTYADLNNKVEDKIKQLIAGGNAQDPVQAAQIINEFINEEVTKLPTILEHRIQNLERVIDKEKTDKKKIATELQGGTEAETKNLLLAESAEDIRNKTLKNLRLIADENVSAEEVKKAKTYLEKYKDKALADLALRSTSSEVVYPSKVFTPTERLSQEERDDAQEKYFQLARWTGEFQDLETLRNKITSHGMRFEYGEDINSKIALMTTPEQIEEAIKATEESDASKTPDAIKRIADIIGEDDYLEFIRNQDKIHKALNK